jgi:C_GCAxxG_C_C family probable redox protein
MRVAVVLGRFLGYDRVTMDKAGEAYALVATGRLSCCQAVINSYAEELGLERGKALRLAQGFGGGLGRMGNVCGAVTGACMLLGLSQPIMGDNPLPSRENTYTLVGEFYRRFSARHGTVMCRELIDYDLSRPEGLAAARENKVFVTICPNFVKSAVEILETLLVSPEAP